ncbi:DUF1275 domain protein [Xylariaceae sp. FL1019]|nr:DUF1275 domain protein [Xylariaceae sp. FL1019]
MQDVEKAAPSPGSNSSLEQVNKHNGKSSGFFTRFSDMLDPRIVYIPMLVCCFATGLTDGTVFGAYKTFVSMQTGNTVFIALGASGQNVIPYAWARSLTSLAAFIAGCVIFSRCHTLLGSGRRRRTAFLSFLAQTVFLVIAAALIQGGVIKSQATEENSASDFTDLAPIALISFQAAGQIVNSRGLGVSEVPSVVVTTLLCDLVSDPAIFVPLPQNAKRNKRAVAFTLTLLGAIVGGFVFKATGGLEYSLWIVAGLKGLITLFWVVAPSEEEKS